MNVDVVTQTEIARPRSVVAAFASDPDNATKWYENIVRVTWETAPPLGLGSRIGFEARFLGRTMRYTYEIAEYVPDERLVMRTSQGPFAMETTYEWRDTASGKTEMTLRNRGRPSGFAKMAGPMMARAMRKANASDLARLKMILEG